MRHLQPGVSEVVVLVACLVHSVVDRVASVALIMTTVVVQGGLSVIMTEPLPVAVIVPLLQNAKCHG